MNRSSAIVNTLPKLAPAVRAQLEQLPGVEIHAATSEGRFIITIEAETDRDTIGAFDRINLINGVLSAAMVYHQFESDPSGAENKTVEA